MNRTWSPDKTLEDSKPKSQKNSPQKKVKNLAPLLDEHGKPYLPVDSPDRRPESVPPGFPQGKGLAPLGDDPRPNTTPVPSKLKEREMERMQKFWDRQETFSHKYKIRMAHVQRDALTESKKMDNIHFWGDKGVEGFKAFLKARYGTIPAAWRGALDTFQNGRLSFAELCTSSRIIGYTGNIREVWETLDEKGTGFITLANLDPEADLALKTFRSILNRKFGNPLKAWNEAFDLDKAHRLDQAQFVARSKKIGYQGNCKKLFKFLQVDPSRQFITLSDIDRSAELAARRGDDNFVSAEPSKWLTEETSPKKDEALEAFRRASKLLTAANVFAAVAEDAKLKREEEESFDATNASSDDDANSRKSTKSHRWSMECANKQRLSLLLEAETKIKLDVGMKTLEEFKACLLVRYGSLLAAWKELLDREGNGHVSFGEFCICLRALGYMGNAKTLWKTLDHNKSGFISFWNLDPQIAEAIASFKDLLREIYGNLLTAWYKALDPRRKGRVQEEQFVECCNKIGYPGNARWLFRTLQPERGRKFLTIADFDTQASHALNRGDFRMMTEKKGQSRMAPTTMSFNDRQECCFSSQWKRAQSIAQREGLKEISDILRSNDIGANSLDALKALLVRRYGSIASAWRQHLDSDGNGKLSFGEFCQAVRMIGYTGNLKNLWRELDEDNSGTISLTELDPEADRCLKEFREMLKMKFGDVFKAWKKGLDINHKGSVEENEFVGRCVDLGWTGCDPKKLFVYLRADQSKRWITISDIDPEVTAAIYRGDYHLITHQRPKSPPVSDEEGGASGEEDRPKSGQAGAGQTVNSVWNEELGKRIKRESMLKASAEKNRRMGAQTLEAFKKQIVTRYGSTVTAWRQALDQDGNGKLSFGEFCMACRELSYNGNMKGLWAELDDDGSGLITLHEIDPVAAKTLEHFRDFLLSKFDNLVTAWHKGLDVTGQIRLNEEDFESRCAALGYEGKIKKVFKWLLPSAGKKYIVVDDLEALLIGINGQTRTLQWAGEQVEKKIEKRDQVEIKSLDGFKRLLIQKFGSLYAGWRKGLDQDQNGLVTKDDFAKGCRAIGFMGNANSLWKFLDEDSDGIVTLKELDTEVGDAIGGFETLVCEKYGSMIEGWKKALDADGNGRLDKEEFVERVKKLGYEGNAAKLFKFLQPEAGRKFITLDDLGTREAAALRRGDWMLDPTERHGPTKRERREQKQLLDSNSSHHLGSVLEADRSEAQKLSRKLGNSLSVPDHVGKT